MGFRFRRQVGSKHLKVNISKRGARSVSLKIAKGITFNTKRGLTLNIPGTGMSYNFGKVNPSTPAGVESHLTQLHLSNSQLVSCKFCNGEIAKGVRKCPHCGRFQKNFFRRHKILIALLIMTALGYVLKVYTETQLLINPHYSINQVKVLK